MLYYCKHRGLTIRIDSSQWSENTVFRWRVINPSQAILLESRVPFRELAECYTDAVSAIDEFLGIDDVR